MKCYSETQGWDACPVFVYILIKYYFQTTTLKKMLFGGT